jgi:hypothetical protein
MSTMSLAITRTARLAVVLLLSQALLLATCAADSSAGRNGPPLKGRHAVFGDDFDNLRVGPGRTWGWQTGAYARCRTNPGGHKVDHLTRSALAVSDGVLTITASRRSDGRWNTGLITTGDSCGTGGNGFAERTGDLVVARVRLPGPVHGGWPGIWSWRNGGREVDLFEWHGDAPGQLELVNHHRYAGKYWHSPLVRPGAWLWLGVLLGATDTVWYVGTSPDTMRAVWTDRKGVGKSFSAHPVLNLSVSDGSHHPLPPRRAGSVRFQIDSFTVYRRG